MLPSVLLTWSRLALVRTGAPALAYIAGAKLGLLLAVAPDHVTMLWPPTGIALAALLVFGYGLWPGVALGAFLVTLSTGVSPATAIVVAVGNTAEALLATYLLRRIAFNNALERIRDVVAFVVLAVGLSTMISATIGVISQGLTGVIGWDSSLRVWWMWWLGDAMGALAVTPALLTWATEPRVSGRLGRIAEAGGLALLVVIVTWLVYWQWSAASDQGPVLYPLFPLVVWAAIRFGPRGVATVNLLIASLAIVGTALGAGPFTGRDGHTTVALQHAFLTVMAVTGMLLAAALAERRRGQIELGARTRQQAAHAGLGTLALAGADIAALMHEAVALVARTLNLEYCKVLELLPDGTLLLRAGVGWKPGYVGRAIVAGEVGSQAGYTLAAKEPVIVEDLRTETRFTAPPLLLEHGVVSGMSVIIQGTDGPFGVLGAHTTRRRSFTQDDIHFIQGVANVLATAIARKRAEEALRKSESTARAVLEAAAEGIVIVNHTGRIATANARVAEMFGYSPDELVGQDLEILVPERLRCVHAGHRQGYFRQPRSRPMGAGMELAGRRKDGSEFPVEISLSFVETDDGTFAMGFITDVTQRRALERSARHAEKLAALGTLSAGIAHELNNPIGIISSRIEVMLIESEGLNLPEELVEDLRVLHRNAQRVARISQGLLAFGRESSEGHRPVDLNHVVDETLLLAGKQLTKDGVRLTTVLDRALPPLLGRPDALQQVLMNLLLNARDAIEGQGDLTIETGAVPSRSGWIRLVVKDTGRGVPSEELEKIFDPFYTTKADGTGLGLSVTYGIVREHRGTIDVQSEPGKGTTFTISFPLLEIQEEEG